MKLFAKHDGHEVPVEVERMGTGYILKIGDKTIKADLVNAGPYVHSLRLDDGTQFGLTHHRTGNHHEVTLVAAKAIVEVIDPLALRRRSSDDEAGSAGIVKAIMPGRIVRILVEEGESVTRGQGLLILEAMKMENEIQSPADGNVSELLVKPGDTVEGGAPLVHIE